MRIVGGLPPLAACLALAVCLLPPLAGADDTGAGSRLAFRLYGGIEGLRSPHVDGLDQRGANLGLGADYRLSEGFSLLSTAEFRSLGPDDTQAFRGESLKLGSVVVSLKVVPFAARSRITPYVTAGIGLLHATLRGPLHEGGRYPSESDTSATIPLGLGLTVRSRRPPALSVFVEAKREFTIRPTLFVYGMEWWAVRLGVSFSR